MMPNGGRDESRDASPWGVGVILAQVSKTTEELKPIVVARGKVTKEIAAELGVEFGTSSSQAALEAWTVLLGLRYWAATLKGFPILLKADSTVALHLTRKLASPTPILNWIGAELALRMESLQIDSFVRRHIHGKLNVEADWLSRPDVDTPRPETLKDFTVREMSSAWMLESEFLPPGKEGHMWGKSASGDGVLASL